MVKHTQTICWLLLTNCLSVFDDFVGLALKGLMKMEFTIFFISLQTHIGLLIILSEMKFHKFNYPPKTTAEFSFIKHFRCL